MLNIPEDVRPSVFSKLDNLILIQTNQTFKTINVVLKHLPSVKNLILGKNHCNDFENIDPEVFKNITYLNLEENGINCNLEIDGDSSSYPQHKLEILGSLQSLTHLNLIKNNIQTMRDISVFKKLELMSLSENNISTDSIIRELSTLPNLQTFSFRRNPLIDIQGEGHV